LDPPTGRKHYLTPLTEKSRREVKVKKGEKEVGGPKRSNLFSIRPGGACAGAFRGPL
jgi:hypothetical protein